MVSPSFSEADLRKVGNALNDSSKPLKQRFRALFTLKNIGGPIAVEEISRCFGDSSALLKHELAYCLGQMRDTLAIPKLCSILEDDREEVIVRHEAGEALGAIGCASVLPLLRKYCCHKIPEIAETCELAVSRIEHYLSHGARTLEADYMMYNSVDPAPPEKLEKSTDELKAVLLDEKRSIFDRYRAMFALRNKCDTESINALAEGFKCSSALFRHEIAFVLGQIASPVSFESLKAVLEDTTEQPMVRHECAEAIGSIASSDCYDILRTYLKDNEMVVKESCVVALDMCEYNNSDEFQYADGLVN